jgi:hypothetical protein
MRLLFTAVIAFMTLPGAVLADNWEIGGTAGYGGYTQVNVTGLSSRATAGLKSGLAFGAVLGDQVTPHISGEIRYTYRFDDLKVSSGSTEASASAESHAIHYDFLFHARRRESAIRPFFAAGAGVKVYRGTGVEAAYQPLSNMVVLTRSTQPEALISVGGGVKASLSRHLLIRFDFRDYLTPVPSGLLAAPPGARVSGWLQDLVGLVGISATF